jgi:hypothetical protein
MVVCRCAILFLRIDDKFGTLVQGSYCMPPSCVAHSVHPAHVKIAFNLAVKGGQDA